jgi:DNA helicase-2/ATP-dependent DNA helicase PcrA
MTAPTATARDQHGVAGMPALSDEQRRVVEHGDGALLMFAGPGAGKTRVLTARVATLLARGCAQPREVLALTFTVRATEELRVRLTALVGNEAADAVTIATFHAAAARILRAHATVFGRTAAYSIYDPDDVARVIRDVLANDAPGDGASTDVSEALAQITTAKGRLWTPDAMRVYGEHPDREQIATIWDAVDGELSASDAFDFGDLVVNSVTLLTSDPAVRARYRRRWRHIVVDEFQDTDYAQFRLLACLAGPAGGAPGGSLVVAGDDDQLLYRWRGADGDNLLEFRRTYPCATEVVLRRNYRSRPEILEAATRCIRHNTRRRAKALIAVRPAGGRVSVARFPNDHAEAAVLAREIATAIDAGVNPREVLVLCRSLRYTRPLQQALTAAAVAYRVVGGHSLWERVEIRDALAYVALVSNSRDAAAFTRAIAAPTDRTQFARARVRPPTRGVGPATQRAVIHHAREHDVDLLTACTAAEGTPGGGRPYAASAIARESLTLFGRQLIDVRTEHHATGQVARAVIGALTITGGPVDCYDELLHGTDDIDVAADCARVKDDLRSLCRAAQDYEHAHGDDATLAGFLERTRAEPTTTLTAEHDTRLTISTIHGAKGTEADVVFLLGCEERLLPTGYAIDSDDPLRIEEERRLVYVAATRARDRFTLTTVAERLGRPAAPSRFVQEAQR